MFPVSNNWFTSELSEQNLFVIVADIFRILDLKSALHASVNELNQM